MSQKAWKRNWPSASAKQALWERPSAKRKNRILREGFSSALYENRAEPLNKVLRTPSFEVKGRKKQSVTHYSNLCRKKPTRTPILKSPKKTLRISWERNNPQKNLRTLPKRENNPIKNQTPRVKNPRRNLAKLPAKREKVLKAKRPKRAGNLKAINSSGTSSRPKLTLNGHMMKPREKLSGRARS